MSQENKLYQNIIEFESLNSEELKKGIYESNDGVQEIMVDLNQVNDRRILVKQKAGSQLDFQKLGVNIVETPESLEKRSYQIVRVPETKDYIQKLEELNKQPEVENAEPDVIRQMTLTVNDPYANTNQWYLTKINMWNAWEVTQGTEDVVVAVLDTGVNASHPDLKGRVLSGYDYVNEDSYPIDDHGHGTQVAGIIAANSNQIGIAGIDLNAKILPIKVANSKGEFSLSNIVAGIYGAIDYGADIINMSYAGYTRNELEQEALWVAHQAGIVLVAAAGNDSTDEWTYPASYNGVISVTATDYDDQSTTFSNYGQWIDVGAPGINIYSTNKSGTYSSDNGTSFSAPIVSGLAALVKSVHPDWTPVEIEWAIEEGAVHQRNAIWDPKVGFGRVDAYETLKLKTSPIEKDASETISLSLNESIYAKMDFPLDIDYFHFTVEETKMVTIDLINHSPHLDLTVVIQGASLNENIYINNLGVGEGENYSFLIKPGTYDIMVFDYYDHWSPLTYELTVSIEDEFVFSDVSGHWAEDAIKFITSLDIIDGYPDGTFRPDEFISRVEAAKLIVTEKGYPLVQSTFSDVLSNDWGNRYIGAAQNSGIITGYPDHTFRPMETLSREEAAAIIERAYELSRGLEVPFVDVNKTSWSYPSIQALVSNQITFGYPDQTFRPQKKITRAEFATFLARLLDDSFRPSSY